MKHDQRKFLIHPYYIMMALTLFGVTALFVGVSIAYLYNRVQQQIPPVELPSLFYWNTLLLLGGSAALWKSKQYYKDDDTERYKGALVVTLIFTILFLVAQIMAWNQMLAMNLSITHSTMASYIYFISGLHFAHVVAGIPFLAYFVFIAVKKMKSPVSVLVYFSDIDKKRKLDLLNIYWHFLDGLWIYLVLFFLINYLVK